MLESSAEGLERAAASRTLPSSPTSPLSCHGLSLLSRRTGEWPPVASIFLLRQHEVCHMHYAKFKISNYLKSQIRVCNNKATHLVQENHWSLPLRLVFWCWADNQKKDNLLPSRLSASRTVQFLLYLRPDTVLDPSSPPPSRHSWLYVGGGGWENQTLQIVSHSMLRLLSGNEAHSAMGSLVTVFEV